MRHHINFKSEFTVEEYVLLCNVAYVTKVLETNNYSFTFTSSGLTGYRFLSITVKGVYRLTVLYKILYNEVK